MAGSALDLEIVKNRDTQTLLSFKAGEEPTVRVSWTYQGLDNPVDSNPKSINKAASEYQPLVFPTRYKDKKPEITELEPVVSRPSECGLLFPKNIELKPETPGSASLQGPADQVKASGHELDLDFSAEKKSAVARQDGAVSNLPKHSRNQAAGAGLSRKMQSIAAVHSRSSNWVGFDLLPELAYMALDLKALAGELSWTGEQLKDVPFMPLEKKAALFKAAMEHYDPALMKPAWVLNRPLKFR